MADGAAIDGPAAPPLLVWGLATFHAALLVALGVGLLYALGVAGNQLAAVGTALGVVAYAYLWGVTWWTNRRWLVAVGADLLAGTPKATNVVAAAVMWGGVAGLGVFVPTFVVAGALFVGAGGVQVIPFLLLGAAIGAALAAGFGGLVGGTFALLDLLLFRAARVWLPVGPVESDSAGS